MGDQTGPGGHPISDEEGRPLGRGCGPRAPLPGDVEAVRAFAEQLRLAPGAGVTVPAEGGVATFTPQTERDLTDLDDVVHRPLPLPEAWR